MFLILEGAYLIVQNIGAFLLVSIAFISLLFESAWPHVNDVRIITTLVEVEVSYVCNTPGHPFVMRDTLEMYAI
jgi:hypothetical protein